MSLAKECYSMKLDLLTNTIVFDDAIRFMEDRQKQRSKDDRAKLDRLFSEGNHKVSQEPDYDYDENELQQQHEKEAKEKATNDIF
ncbi:MAG: hypothetical protein ACJ72X_01940 [Nitrososphaeraceae archaeon]